MGQMMIAEGANPSGLVQVVRCDLLRAGLVCDRRIGMDENKSEGERSRLWCGLQLLSQDEGVWRPNLLELLRGELSEIQRVWSVSLDSRDAACRIISAHLTAHIEKLTPRDARQPLTVEQRERQYKHAVSVCFNILEIPHLRDTKLGQRREWLAKEKRGLLKISISTCQRDMDSRHNPV